MEPTTMTKRRAEVVNDLSRSLVPLDMDTTLIAVVEMSQSSWLVGGIVPGVERQPLKKLAIDPNALLKLLLQWRSESEKKGHRIGRIAVAFEAGHDGFWLARWLVAQGIEPHVIHASSVAVTREHRRAKTDRLDTELLKRAFLGWLRGERGHCKMVAVPTLAEEDAKRPSREREALVAEATRLMARLKAAFVRLGIRSFRLARRERCEAPGERVGALWQRSCSARHDPARLAVLVVPEGQCTRPLVSGADRGRAWGAQDADRCLGAQAPHRAVAARS
jgi:transposase